MESCSSRLKDLDPPRLQVLRKYYKDKLTKHNVSRESRDAMRIGLPPCDTWSDFFKQINEGKRLGNKMGVSRMRDGITSS